MIITDIVELKLPNKNATIEEAEKIIKLLEQELKSSPRHGVGLAAPQIGIHKRIAIIRTGKYSLDLVNPIIVDREHGMLVKGEGCLSFPNVALNTWRFDEVLVKCDKNPAGVVITGLEAVAVLHETDHCDSVLITDRAAMQKVGRNDLCPCGSGKKFKKCHEGR